MDIRQARQVWKAQKAKFALNRETRSAVLGRSSTDAALDVPGAVDHVWARDTAEAKIFYPVLNQTGIPKVADMPVILGYTNEDPTVEQILRIDAAALGNTPVGGVPTTAAHHQQHEFGGGDAVRIEGRLFAPALVEPTEPASMQVVVNTFIYYYDTFRKFDRTLTADLGIYRPSAGYESYLLVAFDPVLGQIVYRPGMAYAVGSPQDIFPTFESVPAPSGNEYPLGWVWLESDTAVVNWLNTADNIGDARLHIGFPAKSLLDRLGQLEGYSGNDPNIALVGAGAADHVPHTLASLTDVSVGSVTNGQALVWEQATGRWIPGAGGGGGSATSFIQLADVPAAYTGASGYAVTVNPLETGLTFSSGVDIGSNAASINGINFLEQAVNPASPDTNHRVLFARSDGVYEKNAAGTVVGPFGTRLLLTATGPSDIAGASSLGTGTSAALGDHVHRGVQSLNVPGNALRFGQVYIESGTGTTVTQSGASILISASGGGGGPSVSSIMVAGASPLQGNVFLLAGAGASLSQSGASITVAATGTANAVSSIGVAGAEPIGGAVTLVQGTGASLSQSGGSITIAATGGGTNAKVFGGRLTLDGNQAVPNHVGSASVVYYIPYISDQVSIYNSASAWEMLAFTAPSLALTSLSPNSAYDIFGYKNGAELILESARWNVNNSTRFTATSAQDGIQVSSTNKTRLLLGTIYVGSTSGVSEDSQQRRFVSNQYNRVQRNLGASEPNSSWTYSTQSWRSLNNSSNNRVQLVNTASGGDIDVSSFATVTIIQIGGLGMVGIGENVTNDNHGYAGRAALLTGSSGARLNVAINAQLKGNMSWGYYFYQAVELVAGGISTSYTGHSGTAPAGIIGFVVN